MRLVVSTLSQCASLKALTYDMRRSVLCRRWKPMMQRKEERTMRAVEHNEVLHAESPRHTIVHQRLHRLGLELAHLQRERSGRSPYHVAPA